MSIRTTVAEMASQTNTVLQKVLARLEHLKEKGIDYKDLRESMKELRARRYGCIHCDCEPDYASDFMVKDELWEEVVGFYNVIVCLPCFEQLIGRDVVEDDLKRDSHGAHLPINYELLKEPEPVTLIIEDTNARAKAVAANEGHYAAVRERLTKKLLSARQRAMLEEVEENPPVGTAHGVRSDPVRSNRKRAANQIKTNAKKKKR